MSLSIKEIEHLAFLAYLELTQEEKERYCLAISSILQYINKIQELRVDNQLESEDYFQNQTISRDDRVAGIPLAEQRNLIGQAPDNDQNLIKTKAVFDRN